MSNEAVEAVKASGVGQYLPARQTFKSLDGRVIANWLRSQGYSVIEAVDTGRNGLAVTACGIAVSSNGYVSKLEDKDE